jgi:two-component system, OmpR family, response regulator QseB
LRVVIVEDDLQLGAALSKALEQAGYDSVWVRRLSEARAQLTLQPAAMILDINLPDGEGFTLLTEVRQRNHELPIIVMTARDGLSDRLRGLDNGADDYLVKPFAASELIARLRAVMRRAAGHATDQWHIGQVMIDIARRVVVVEQTEVALTPTEYRLLVELALSTGKVVLRDALIERLWSNAEQGSEAALEVQVHGLRRKIGAERIRTVRGAGYSLEAI